MDEIRKFEVLKEGIVPAIDGENVQSLPVGAVVLEALLGDKAEELLANGSVIEVVDHEVTQEDLDANPDAELALGDVITLPKPIAESEMTDEDKAVRDAAEAEAKAAEGEEVAPATPAEPVMTYAGKTVISSSVRDHAGKEVHVITLEGGEVLDISDEEYEAMVAEAK